MLTLVNTPETPTVEPDTAPGVDPGTAPSIDPNPGQPAPQRVPQPKPDRDTCPDTAPCPYKGSAPPNNTVGTHLLAIEGAADLTGVTFSTTVEAA
ncbi:MAG: hypothetical protein J0M12_18175 [Deltaproteobacteria bacterium]|nr:hypothetical protein [Deltaproteobacteria bacterium]